LLCSAKKLRACSGLIAEIAADPSPNGFTSNRRTMCNAMLRD
jgi:hypothetical protein